MSPQTRKALELAREALEQSEPKWGERIRAMSAIDAALSAPAAPVAQPLTDEQVMHEFDVYIGQPVLGYPLDTSDVIAFARAIERAHGITKGRA